MHHKCECRDVVKTGLGKEQIIKISVLSERDQEWCPEEPPHLIGHEVIIDRLYDLSEVNQNINDFISYEYFFFVVVQNTNYAKYKNYVLNCQKLLGHLRLITLRQIT